MFALLQCAINVSSFIDRLIILARWIAITGAQSLKSLAKIWSILEATKERKYNPVRYQKWMQISIKTSISKELQLATYI